MSKATELQERVRRFAVRIVRFVGSLLSRPECDAIGRQLARAGTGVAGNYNASCRSRSLKEFAARMGVACEEADETVLWLNVVAESGVRRDNEAIALLEEARELRAILGASVRTCRQHLNATRKPGVPDSD